MVINILPAATERFSDVEHALTGGGDGGSCWCQWWMMRNKDFDRSTNAERRERLRTDLNTEIPPGLVAYADGEAAGWVKVAPRPQQPRLAFTRLLKHSPEPIDDESLWAVTCFVVRREFRGNGISLQLLDAAVAHAREYGGRILEGYPVDTTATQASANSLYHGALSTFLAAGFREVARPKPTQPIVSLPL